jgi:MFS family permease
MFKNNKNLIIIALIAVVNALGYGIIIPVIYTYSKKYGLSDFENGLLFALFSLCQFISTPIIGRMSDKYGRKPMLVASITGTAISFVMMAFAPSALFLFIARALDGLTAGNIPVASAVITDTTKSKDRAKGFGIIGASFGFGFVFGPAISALTLQFGEAVPFLIAAAISIIAVVVTVLFLPETNKHMGEIKKAKLFDLHALVHIITDKNVGITFVITLCYSVAFSMFIYAFQPFSVHVLNLSATQIAQIFMAIGIVGVLSQVVVLPFMSKRLSTKTNLSLSILAGSFIFFGMALSHSLIEVIIVNALFGLFSSLTNPMLQAVLSKETDAVSQGSIMGLNAAYISVGQVVGPILGGALATISIRVPFVAAGALVFVCFLLSFGVLKKGVAKEHAFN